MYVKIIVCNAVMCVCVSLWAPVCTPLVCIRALLSVVSSVYTGTNFFAEDGAEFGAARLGVVTDMHTHTTLSVKRSSISILSLETEL